MPDELKIDRLLLPVFGRLVVIASLAVSAVDIYLLEDKRFIFPNFGLVGYFLLLLGVSLVIIARLTLRKFYSETVQNRKDQQLITCGIYRFIRHPIYLGTLLFAFSAPIIVRSILGFLIMLLLVPMIIRRIRLEEKLLTEKFGQHYMEYARKTKRFIPYVY